MKMIKIMTNTKRLSMTLKIEEQEVVAAADHFNLTVEQLIEFNEEGDMRVFPSYEECFKWVHEGASEKYLIQLLWDGKTAMNIKNYYVLENGTTIYIYR